MTRNVGSIDRIVVVLGLISIAFWGPQTPRGWIGVVPLLTAVVGWCPPYALLGINTCGRKGA